jgi:hypothetical protein
MPLRICPNVSRTGVGDAKYLPITAEHPEL